MTMERENCRTRVAKQKLLELEDPISRLEILEKYLDQRKLLG